MPADAKVEPNQRTLGQDDDPTLVQSEPGPTSSEQPSWGRRLRQRIRQFKRSTQFVIAAALILGLTMSLVGNLVSQRIERAAVQSAAQAGALYMENFLEPFVQELARTQDIPPESAAAIDRLIINSSLNRHVASVKIWRPDGTVIYSTDKSVVHRKFPTDEIDEALKGAIVTNLEDLGQEENAFERGLKVPLYEIYAPLRETGSGKVVAVGEFYERADQLEQEIHTVRLQVWAVVGSATLAMLGLLFFVVRRGERIIEHQQLALKQRMAEQVSLHAHNADLQRRITTANQEFSRISELTLRRLGADLHDGPAQLLTLILVRLDELAQLRERLQQQDESLDSDALETLRSAGQDALREIRDISRGLAVPEINELSLEQVLRLVVQRHEQRTDTQVELDIQPLPANATMSLKICLYRFTQEALNNAVMHAGGQGQKLSARMRDGQLEVQVADTGNGFIPGDQASNGQGRRRLGLAGMRYRVEALGGQFDIQSKPGEGTLVSARFRMEEDVIR
ncbi:MULTISPECIES: sensor histidine kinase [unclassified Pseudomonas]|jgi:signal transduction histidine kinase|uniref:sensor histidine kinase n=1 Tax=unclassified Pseudomonas TaxID=196821 RepID=UPI00129D557A|nr:MULTISPECIES: ATP-binding protein [unclassified Pseudomonas]MDH4655010.1 sensor histidine kinase [Pseudomonas sp. BN606]MRK19501.1 sensor histidine kinase [Pseudomonas sp. JG-B]